MLIALSFFITLPNFVEQVQATDYDIFSIPNANGNLYQTYVWDNFLYVYNNTQILQYDLSTKTLNDTMALGGSTLVYSTIGRGSFWYLNATVIGVPYVIAIDLPNFIEADRILKSSLTGWNDDIKNLAYLYDSGIDYWAWGNITGTEIQVYDDVIMTMNAYGYPYPQSPKFVAFANINHGTFTALVYAYSFIWNGTGVEYDVTSGFTVSQHRGATYGWTWDLTPSISDSQIHQNNEISYRQHGYNIGAISDAEARFEDTTYFGVYATSDMLGIHSLWNEDFKETDIHPTGSDNYDYFYDTSEHTLRIDVNDKNNAMFATHQAGLTPPYTSTFSSFLELDLVQSGDWDRPIKEGVIAGLNSLDENGFDALYIAYVQDANQTPIAIKAIGAGSQYDVVGVLPPPYDPDNCVLWSNMVDDWDDYQDDSIVAVWTENADTSLYVCVNLIEGQYMRYGETLNVQAQVYKHYPTGTTDNWRLETRWMIDQTNYPRITGETVYVYQDDVYLHSLTTSGYGVTQAIYAFNPASYPTTISCYMNKTGYNDQWLNVTYYSWSSQSSDTTITEEPVMTLDFTDNRETENMRVTVSLLRYTGEQYGDDWYNELLNIHTYVETYAGDSLDSVIDVGVRDLDVNGQVEFILSYTEPYGYIVKHYFNVDEQWIYIGNFTENSQIQFAYDASTGNVTEGDYVSLPDTPTQTEFYPTGDEAINPTTLEGFAVIWSGNSGFLVALGFITAITIGFAKYNPASAIFGVITLVGMTVGFLGYTGLLPFPIFVVVLLVIVLGITIIFTNLLTGGRGNKSE